MDYREAYYLDGISNGTITSCARGWAVNDARTVVYAKLMSRVDNGEDVVIISATLDYIIEAAKERKYDLRIDADALSSIVVAVTIAAQVKPLTKEEKESFLANERIRLTEKYGADWVWEGRHI